MLISTVNLFNILPYQHDSVFITLSHVGSLYLNSFMDVAEFTKTADKDVVKFLKKIGFKFVNERVTEKFLKSFAATYIKEQCLATTQTELSFTKKFTGAQLVTLIN